MRSILHRGALAAAFALPLALAVASIPLSRAEEECVPETMYRTLYVRCQDGSEVNQGGETTCKDPATWKTYAQEFCKGRCAADASKCGIVDGTYKTSDACGTTSCELTIEKTRAIPCPDPYKQTQTCKRRGLGYTSSVDANGCRQIQCLDLSAGKSERVCQMSEADLKAKISDCAKNGFRAITESKSGCQTFLGCGAPIDEVKDKGVSPVETNLTCKLATVEGRPLLRCADGTLWMPYQQTKPTLPKPAPKPAMTVPASRCSGYERAVKELKARVAKEGGSADLSAKLKEAMAAWEECRRANRGQTKTP